MTPIEPCCPHCGHPRSGTACAHCDGRVRGLDGRGELPPIRADRLRDFASGLGDVRRALFALLHGREFVGLLRLPVAANTIAFLLLVVGGWLLLAPAYTAAFAGPWWLLDGVRAHCAADGPSLWLAATWLLLGHPLLDLIAGQAQEPLRAATERRMLGPTRGGATAPGALQLRARVRVLTWLLLAWPIALALVLVPWFGLPLVALLGAAVAAVVWFEAPMAPRGWPLVLRLQALRSHRWRALGVGLGLQVASAVPFVNLLALAPIATIAATASFLRFQKQPPA